MKKWNLENSSQKDDYSPEMNVNSGSKTEPPHKNNEQLLNNEEIPNEVKNYLTSIKKGNKRVTKIAHLNSLAGILNEMGENKSSDNHSDNYPQIIFHTPECPLPKTMPRRHCYDNQSMSPCFKNNERIPCPQDYEKNGIPHCQNPGCNHEKTLCHVVDSCGHPIPFDQKCPTHPCYLVIPETPDSKRSNSLLKDSVPECENPNKNIYEESK